MTRMYVNINPAVLQWARTEAGYKINEIAKKLRVDIERYRSWETEGKKIPFGTLQKIANYYKRQIAVFFLDEVPESFPKPKDYRNLLPDRSQLSPKSLLALRRSTYLQEIARDLEGVDYWKKRLEWLHEIQKIKNEIESIKHLRQLLDINVNQQLKWKSENEAYKNWRRVIEDKLGILIFQFSMPLNELHGSCLTDNIPYVIVTNSNHSYTARIFTLFHELAHIIRNQSGMCLVDRIEQDQKEEWACNSFAGRFLVPVEYIVPTDNLKEIASYAKKFKVSREVYLRRLKEEGLIPDAKFYTLLDEIKASYKKNNPPKGFVKPEVQSRTSRGETFYHLIFEALNANKINYTDAAHALGIKVNRLLNEF